MLRWAAPTLDAQGGQLSDLGRYILFRAKESTSAFVAVDTLGAEVRQYTDTGLDESTIYYYAVSAAQMLLATKVVVPQWSRCRPKERIACRRQRRKT